MRPISPRRVHSEMAPQIWTLRQVQALLHQRGLSARASRVTKRKRPRRNHSARFKAKGTIDAIKGEKTLAELAKLHDVHANQINDWETQRLDRAGSVFGAESAAPPTVALKRSAREDRAARNGA